MLIYREIQKCLRSLLLHRLRALLSTLGVLFGVAAVIAMLSIGEGAKQETLEQIAQLGMNTIIVRQAALSDEQQAIAWEMGSKGLTLEDAEALKQNIPFPLSNALLKTVEATLNGTLTQISPEILAVDRNFGEMKKLQLTEGRFICDLDRTERKLCCVLGWEVAESLGKDGHAGCTLRLKISPMRSSGC